MCCRVVLKLLLFVCTPQYKKVYWGNHTTGSLVQDIYTNTIEHFEVCATRFIKKAIYIPHMGVQNITITVHSYSPRMGVHYIANTGSLIQDIFTNTIEPFENCATRFIEKKNNIYTTYGSSKHNYYRSLLLTTYGSSLHSKYCLI